jgi:hypothetical protein
VTADISAIRGGRRHTRPLGLFDRLADAFQLATMSNHVDFPARRDALQAVLAEANDLHNPATLGFEARTWLCLRAMMQQWLDVGGDHALRADTSRIVWDIVNMARRQRERALLAGGSPP